MIWGLAGILLVVLVLPFLLRRVEHNLEAFLLVMGVLSVTIAGVWSPHLVREAFLDPIRIQHPIVEAVLLAGLLFQFFRDTIRHRIMRCVNIVGPRLFFFLVVVVLGLVSSVITAIIAALVLAEVVTVLRLNKQTEARLVIVTCFSIGLGAALTPVGEPLATIAIAKLKGVPYEAGFWFLFEKLGVYIISGILALGLLAMTFHASGASAAGSLREDRPETFADIFIRSGKVYFFVMALVFLGAGFEPLIDAYIIQMPSPALYWINMISAIVDNATLTAAELGPKMELKQIQAVLMGLILSGGMLIPGNIPNIIAAGKLRIGSRQWAALGVPLGLVLMVVYHVVLFVLT